VLVERAYLPRSHALTAGVILDSGLRRGAAAAVEKWRGGQHSGLEHQPDNAYREKMPANGAHQ
jgi:hypothetical protein